MTGQWPSNAESEIYNGYTHTAFRTCFVYCIHSSAALNKSNTSEASVPSLRVSLK